MATITIPTYHVSDDSMGDGWRDQAEAATEFAAYLVDHLPGMVSEDGDSVEFAADRTGHSGCVNNACAYVEIDGIEDEGASHRVQIARERLWERFCNERGDLAG